jgi:hypothetical protein
MLRLHHFHDRRRAMIEDTAVLGTIANGPLAFLKDRDVTEPQFESFRAAVQKNAEHICKGIVAELLKHKVHAKVVNDKPGHWLVAVGNDGASGRPESRAVTANITFTAAAADIPAVVNALNGFFGNWRVVAGLIALGAAYVAGQYVLHVARVP